LILLILDALLLSVVVLLQAGQGGGLASLGGGGGTENVLGGRQAVTILTRLSWWCGGIFLALSLVLSVMRRGPGGSELQQRLRQSAPPAAEGAGAAGGPSPLQGLTPTPAPGAANGAAPATPPATTPPANNAPAQPAPSQPAR
jgi:preprotein translocase subunit SecG